MITQRTSIVPSTPVRRASGESITSAAESSTGISATTSSSTTPDPPPHGGVAHSGPPPAPPGPAAPGTSESSPPRSSPWASDVVRVCGSTGRGISSGVRTVRGGFRPFERGGVAGGVPGLPPPPRGPGWTFGHWMVCSGARGGAGRERRMAPASSTAWARRDTTTAGLRRVGALERPRTTSNIGELARGRPQSSPRRGASPGTGQSPARRLAESSRPARWTPAHARGRTDRPMLTAALALALAAAPPARTSPVAERTITADAIRAHVRFLASDLLEGRGPGTRGDALAQAYIASELEALGLRPAGTRRLPPAVRHRRRQRPRREPPVHPRPGVARRSATRTRSSPSPA